MEYVAIVFTACFSMSNRVSNGELTNIRLFQQHQQPQRDIQHSVRKAADNRMADGLFASAAGKKTARQIRKQERGPERKLQATLPERLEGDTRAETPLS